MSKLLPLKKELQNVGDLKAVSEAFETIASVQLRQIKGRVISSRKFFHELWGMYSQLRVLPRDRFSSVRQQIETNKRVVIVVTSETGLSGGIDQRLIDQLLNDVDLAFTDIVVIGKHGAQLLAARSVKPVAVFPLPNVTKKIHVAPIISLASSYAHSSVYYESFVSLTTQRIAHFELLFAVQKLSALEQKNEQFELIYSHDYIFEPSPDEVITYMESMMLASALTEVILESRLAQLASRFGAMNRARIESNKQLLTLSRLISRTHRQQEDEASRLYRKPERVV